MNVRKDKKLFALERLLFITFTTVPLRTHEISFSKSLKAPCSRHWREENLSANNSFRSCRARYLSSALEIFLPNCNLLHSVTRLHVPLIQFFVANDVGRIRNLSFRLITSSCRDALSRCFFGLTLRVNINAALPLRTLN